GGFTRQFGKEYFYTSRVSVSGDGRLAAVMRSPDGNDSVIDVIDVATGAPVARASVTTNRNVPTFVLSSDGQSLAIHDSNTRKVYLYDLSRLGP
ncbi:MAG TPA: hypothetical protein VKE74_05995, partial [Gemmataceae bacterium]|nr:hypothetical protein [Gemmataceae bacterium]